MLAWPPLLASTLWKFCQNHAQWGVKSCDLGQNFPKMYATVKLNWFQTIKDADLDFKLDGENEIIDYEIVGMKSTHHWENTFDDPIISTNDIRYLVPDA